jgi:hypothetical protein
MRLVLGKAGKAIGLANIRAAQLESDNRRLQYQLNQVKDKRVKKRVQINPNERFADIEAIKAAIDQAAEIKAQRSTRDHEKEARASAAAAATLSIAAMSTQWQI